MTIYLVDTCIWRDFYESRVSREGNRIGVYASDFFIKILERKDKILFSEGLWDELSIAYSTEEIEDMLNLMIRCNVLIKIEAIKEEILEAKMLSNKRNIPFIDCLNAVQARNHSAILITRDKHYFNELKDVVKAYKPEDVV